MKDHRGVDDGVCAVILEFLKKTMIDRILYMEEKSLHLNIVHRSSSLKEGLKLR
ncbi:MAG: hypothetical protein Q4P28_05395 [Tissierellia bacterium]|nr:hypothetical protein [Tissierellia bacterium]